MLQTKSIVNPNGIGEKVISFLRQPLFTIPLPNPIQVKVKPVSQNTVNTVAPGKGVKSNRNRSVPSNLPQKRIPTRNNQNRKSAQYIFAPAKNKEEFDKILFVLKACDKSNENAMYTNVLHIEQTDNGSKLVATDGKRMHVTEIEAKIKPGDYKPVITKNMVRLEVVTSNVNYPDWKKVVPVNVKWRGNINLENRNASQMNDLGRLFTEKSGEKVNPRYLADLTKKQWIIYCQNEKRKAVLLKEFRSIGTYAVIMPLS